jgi:sialate O-acetylesterase
MFALLAIPALRAQVAGPVRLAGVFGDHMVLQRDQPLRVWGTAPPAQEVVVRFGDLERKGLTDARGAWLVTLPAMAANDVGRDLLVEAGDAIVVRDVVVGDVWLCSGQSNMAMGLGSCEDAAALAALRNPWIRYRPYFEHFAGTAQEDLRDQAAWRAIAPDTAGGCTAVGYWFAQNVQPVVGIPIGLLECTVGGTEIECWMPPEAFSEFPENAPIAAQLQAAIADWQRELVQSLPHVEAWLRDAKAAAAAGNPVPEAPRLRGHPNEDRDHWVRTTSLWNGMVHPMLPFAMRGVLWYQGENNGSEQASYVTKLQAMVTTWRRAWGQELPFYYVQLPNYGRPDQGRPDGDPAGGDLGFAPCRMAQLLCTAMPRVGMAVTIDCGDPQDIHPRDKRTVGERLARWALRAEYGQQIEPSGPLFARTEIDGSTVRVQFTHIGKGLMVGARSAAGTFEAAPAGALRAFAIAGADRQWHWAESSIEGDCVVLRAEAVPEPKVVRYAYTACPRGPFLYNGDGLPASPFRSDDW